MIEKIKALIDMYKSEVAELEESYGENLENLDPMDASGGNFNDAYDLGYGHGETYGRLVLLGELLEGLEKQGDTHG